LISFRNHDFDGIRRRAEDPADFGHQLDNVKHIAIAGVVGLIIFPQAAPSSRSHMRFPVEKGQELPLGSFYLRCFLGYPSCDT
jgi:hypothetical protein